MVAVGGAGSEGDYCIPFSICARLALGISNAEVKRQTYISAELSGHKLSFIFLYQHNLTQLRVISC